MDNIASFTKIYHHDTYPDIDPTQPKVSAAGKHVVVTGGGTGIGKSIAKSFAKAGAASVAIISRRATILEQASKDIAAVGTSTKVMFAVGDAADKASLESALKDITDQTGGRIDILVSNAASFWGPSHAADTAADVLKSDFEATTVSSLNFFQAFLPYAAKQACIVNISSCVVHMAPVPRVLNYAVTKLAGLKIFDYIALEYPDFHVVNVQPGALATDMNTLFRDQSTDSLELPGHFVVWLASPEAKFLRSKFVWANWDVKELMARKDEIEGDPHLLRVNLSGVPM